MKPGRNEPCHCGSGRKYKNCCLSRDEQSRVAANTKDSRSARSPADEAWNARWDEFKAADYQSRIDLFLKTLEIPQLMDGDMAFEMLSVLFADTAQHAERARFDALVESLREMRHEVYAKDKHFFLKWRITNALVDGRSQDVTTLFRELASMAGSDIDVFNRVEECLAYHGYLSALVEAMHLAWPGVEDSDGIVPWGVDEFRTRAISYELLYYADRTPAPDVASPELLQRLEFFSEIDPVLVNAYLAHLAGRAGRAWKLSDFELPRRRNRKWDDDEPDVNDPQSGAELNLYHLTVDFLGYLRRCEGWSYSKGELARRDLHSFILERHDGRLEYRDSMLNDMMREKDRQRGRRLPPKHKFQRYTNVLLPDRERLEHFLAHLLDLMNQLQHRAAALFEIIPAWLRFLETHRLIDPENRLRTIANLSPLAEDLLIATGHFTDDPSPHAMLARWREGAERALCE